MAYLVYFDKMLFPITPSKIEMKIKNNNKTIDLVNLGEVNILKTPGLTEISFDALFPMYKLPFVKEGFKSVDYYLSVIEKLKNSKTYFPFIVSRTTMSNKKLFNTNMNVTLEEYTIKEEAKEGPFVKVSFKLKQYKPYSTKKIIVKNNNGKTQATKVENRPSKPTPKTYTVKKGDSLWSICKTQLGDGSKKTYEKVYQLNKDMMDKRNKGKNVPK